MNQSRIADKCRAADRLIARIDERERNSQVSGGADAIKAPVDSAGWGRVIKSGIDAHDAGQKRSATVNLAERECTATPGEQSPLVEAPTEAERAVDKYWGKYLLEIAKLQRAVDGIAVKTKGEL